MRLPRVLRPLSRLVVALQGVEGALGHHNVALTGLRTALLEQGPASERLEVLERSRHQFEAQCEGLLLKAEGKLRAANNAEARERALRKTYEHLIDPLDEVGVEPETPTRNPSGNDDAPASEAQRLQALRMDVAPSNKTLAQRAKFGVR